MEVTSQLKVGDAAPDTIVFNENGQPIHLRDVWANQPTLICFLRYFGCIICRRWIAKVEQRHEEIEAAGLKIFAIGAGESRHVSNYSSRYAPHVQCACSEDSSAHAAFGLKRHTIGALFSRDVIVSHARAVADGFTPGLLNNGDIKILVGTFIVDSQSIVRYAYYSRYVGDDPSIDDILQEFLKSKSE